MLTIVLVVLLVIVAGIVAFVAMQPAEFRISRSAVMSAPASRVFAHVNDLHQWEAWSPWAKRDPAMKETYEGPASGVGASHWWSGNNQVGEGRMTITESQADTVIRMRLEFLRPMKATNTTEFTFESVDAGTRMTWSMTGSNNFMGKAFGLIMNMDKMVGGDFETGLASLKAIVEQPTE